MGKKKTTGKSKKTTKKPAAKPKVKVSADGLNIHIQINPPKEKTFEVAAILDRSGSMESMRDEAIVAFNSFIDAQKKDPGTTLLTLVQFDTAFEVNYESKPLDKVPYLSRETFVPRNGTALLDAIGRTIKMLDAKNTNDVILVILTDGQENSSIEYKPETIKAMLKERENRGWMIQYLAASADKFTQESIKNYFLGTLGSSNLNTRAYGSVREAYADSVTLTSAYKAGKVNMTGAATPVITPSVKTTTGTKTSEAK